MDVAVGVGVSGLCVGTGVRVGVAEGSAAAVCVAAALAVCTIKVLILPGSAVGMDWAVSDGTHAMIRVSTVTQINSFVLCVVAIVFSSTSGQGQTMKSFYF